MRDGKLIAIQLWDFPVRFFHWGLVLGLGCAWYTIETGQIDLHYYSGLFLIWLLTFRILWGFIGNRPARFCAFVRGPRAMLAYLGGLLQRAPSYSAGHNPLGAVMVLAMLAVIAFQLLSGLVMTDDIMYDAPLRGRLPAALEDFLAGLHEGNFNLILALAGIHVVTILLYRLFKRENLAKAMVTGRADLPAEKAALLKDMPRRPVWLGWLAALIAAAVPAAIHLLA